MVAWRRAIIWINGGLFYWYIYALPERNELTHMYSLGRVMLFSPVRRQAITQTKADLSTDTREQTTVKFE